MAVFTTELEPWQEYLHIICLCILGIFLLISAFQVCMSSINDQPRIHYRFLAMLFTFAQFLFALLALIYFTIEPNNIKYRAAVALFSRLCGCLGRIFGVCCGYCFLLSIVKSLYHTPTYKRRIPRWFQLFAQICCLLIIALDVVLTLVTIISGSTRGSLIYMWCLASWSLLFCAVLTKALLNAKKQTQHWCQRASKAYSNDVLSAQNTEGKKYNPSSSQFDVNTVSLPKSANLLDIESKSLRSQYVNNAPFNSLKQQLCKIQLMIAINFVVAALVLGLVALLALDALRMARHQMRLPPATQPPMVGINIYALYTGFTMVYIASLLWWLYIPRSILCDNIRIDSIFYACCTSGIECCCELQPSDIDEHHNDAMAIDLHFHPEQQKEFAGEVDNGDAAAAPFDIFSVGAWRSTFRFRLSTYRGLPGKTDGDESEEHKNDSKRSKVNSISAVEQGPEHSDSFVIDEHGDHDYNTIPTVRQASLPLTASQAILESNQLKAKRTFSGEMIDRAETHESNDYVDFAM